MMGVTGPQAVAVAAPEGVNLIMPKASTQMPPIYRDILPKYRISSIGSCHISSYYPQSFPLQVSRFVIITYRG